MNLSNLKPRTIIVIVVVAIAVLFIGRQIINSFNRSNNIGELVTAAQVDRDLCPVNETTVFSSTDSVHVVVRDSDVLKGTSIYARLYYGSQPVEDSQVITADQDYTNTCIDFVFEATSSAGRLDSGSYEAQLIVNGNPGATVDFQVE